MVKLYVGRLMFRKGKFLVVFSVLLSLGTVANSADIKLATGGVTGVYYPIGQAICELMGKTKVDHSINCEALTTDGSVENVKGLDQKIFNFGLIQSDIQMEALNGVRTFRDDRPQIYLRSVFSLHSEPLHLMVSKNSGIKSIDDLKGKSIDMGSVGSGSHVLSSLILREKGWQKGDFSNVFELSPQDQLAGLCKGKVQASLWVAGVKNETAHEAANQCGVRLISMKGEWVRILLLDYPQYAKATIPAGAYTQNAREIESFGPKATLMTNADVSEEVVYQLVKSVFDNFKIFKGMHPALSLLKPKEMLDDGVIAPLHPGAIRYYKEKGWM